MAERSEQPKLLELFFVFLRISACTIGGGYVMFPLMKREVADARGWITADELVDYFALGQSIPGIIAMNTATLIGYRKRGIPGAVAAAVGMAAPSLICILLIALFFIPYFDHPWVSRAFAGIRAAVVALLVSAAWQIGQKAVRGPVRLAIAAAAFLMIAGLQLHPAFAILGGGALGGMLFRKEATVDGASSSVAADDGMSGASARKLDAKRDLRNESSDHRERQPSSTPEGGA